MTLHRARQLQVYRWLATLQRELPDGGAYSHFKPTGLEEETPMHEARTEHSYGV